MANKKEHIDLSQVDDIKNLSPEESVKVRDRDIKISLTPLFCVVTSLITIILTAGIYLIKRDLMFTIQAALVIPLLIYVSAVDLKLHMAPNWISIALAIIGIPNIIVSAINSDYNDLLYNRFLGLIVGFLFLFVAGFISKGGIGAADIKITTAMGLFMGFEGIFTGQLIGIFFAAIVSIILLIIKKADKKTRIALLPYLSAGMVVAMFLPNNLLF